MVANSHGLAYHTSCLCRGRRDKWSCCPKGWRGHPSGRIAAEAAHVVGLQPRVSGGALLPNSAWNKDNPTDHDCTSTVPIGLPTTMPVSVAFGPAWRLLGRFRSSQLMGICLRCLHVACHVLGHDAHGKADDTCASMSLSLRSKPSSCIRKATIVRPGLSWLHCLFRALHASPCRFLYKYACNSRVAGMRSVTLCPGGCSPGWLVFCSDN